MPSEKTKEQVKELTDMLENGVRDLFQSDKYQAYLDDMAELMQFSSKRYSARNHMLITMQGGSLVAGFHAWKEYGRHVTSEAKGKGIKILAPAPYTITVEEQVRDPDTNMPLYDTEGNPLMEEVKKEIPDWKYVTVFDISVTDGKPLPQLAEDLTGNVQHYDAFMDALGEVSPLPIEYGELPSGTDGTAFYGDRIVIQEGMSQRQSAAAGVHEVAHAILHDTVRERAEGEAQVEEKTLRMKEIEAESIAYVVCKRFGVETDANSFGYLAHYQVGENTAELMKSLDTIKRTAEELIDKIDERFKAICQERGIDLSPIEAVHAPPSREDAEQFAAQFHDYMSGVTEKAGLPPFSLDSREQSIADITQDIINGNHAGIPEMLQNTADHGGKPKPLLKAFDKLINSTPWVFPSMEAPAPERYEAVNEDGYHFVRNAETGLFHANENGLIYQYTDAAAAQEQADTLNRAAVQATMQENAPAPAQPQRVKPWQEPNPTPYWQAHGLIEEMEKDATIFGPGERNLIVNYAMHIGDMDKVKDLADEIAASIRQKGYTSLAIEQRANAEIEASSAEARPAPPTQQEVAGPAPAAPGKEYDLGYGHLGNGLTVWNRLEERDGDYVTVAHIGPDRDVTYYDKDLPDELKAEIEQEARTSNITVSATQDTPVFNTPPEPTVPPPPDRQPGYEQWSEPATPENAPATPGAPSDDIDAYLPEQQAPANLEPAPDTADAAGEIAYTRMANGVVAYQYVGDVKKDYEEVARIFSDRSIVFSKQDIPSDIRDTIVEFAATADIPNMEPEPAPPKPANRKYFITENQREQAERMAAKWETRAEAFYAGGDGWGADTAGYCKTPEDAEKAEGRAASIHAAINALVGGNGTWADVQVIRQAVAQRDGLDASIEMNRDARPQPEPEQAPAPADEAPADKLTDLQRRSIEIAQKYEKLPMQERMDIIAQTFGCKTAHITTSPCTGKWRGTSDVSLVFDNGASLFIGNHMTPKAKTKKVQNEYINSALRQYNPEIVRESKELATTALREREAKDNAVAAEKGLKPYTFLNVELHDGSEDKSAGHMGWYYVTLAVDDKIFGFVETGLNYDICDGRLTGEVSRKNYFVAGGMKDSDVDFVMNNVGHSSFNGSHQLPLTEAARERAEKTLAERSAPALDAGQEPDYNITYWQMGSGTLALHYFNEGTERYGDFEELAHIAPDRSVTFRDVDMPDEVRERIAAYALTAEIPDMQPDLPQPVAVDDVAGPQQAPEQVRAEPEQEPDELFPDPGIGLSERDLYGYTDPAMLPMLQDRALELFDQDLTVYMLYVDGTEAMAFDREEIEAHDGIFGIEADEWQASRAYTEMEARQGEAKRETALLDSPEDAFGIYQLKGGDDLHYHRWLHFDEVGKYDLSIERGNYELVYTAPLQEGATLADITRAFAMDERPADFHGHSLSTSDVVVFNKGGEITAYYDDGGPFVPLPSFTGREQQPEQAAPQQPEQQAAPAAPEPQVPPAYDGPSVAELEATMNAGGQISLTDYAKAIKNEPQKQASRKEKPSVLAFLQKSKQEAREAQKQQKPAPKRDNDREV